MKNVDHKFQNKGDENGYNEEEIKEEEEDDAKWKKKKLGGVRTMPFILGENPSIKIFLF